MNKIIYALIVTTIIGCKEDPNKSTTKIILSSSSNETYEIKHTKLNICNTVDTVAVPQVWSSSKNNHVDKLNQKLISNTMKIIGDCPDLNSESPEPKELPSVEFSTYIKNNHVSIVQSSRIVLGMGEHVTTEVLNTNLSNGKQLILSDVYKIPKQRLREILMTTISTNKNIFTNSPEDYLTNYNFENPPFYISNDSIYTFLDTQTSGKHNSYEIRILIGNV